MIATTLLGGCAEQDTATGPSVERDAFGVAPEGDSVDLYTLVNENGMSMRVMTYGGVIQSLEVPDRDGNLEDAVLGFDSLEGYTRDAYREANPYFGALIGRYGNRIDEGQFSIDGETYTLETNNGPNHLHGGTEGFDQVVWDAEPFERGDSTGVVLTHTTWSNPSVPPCRWLGPLLVSSV